VQATIAGKPPGMPAKGLCISCSDAELRAAVEYMVSKSQ
jgi:cytochrome c5